MRQLSQNEIGSKPTTYTPVVNSPPQLASQFFQHSYGGIIRPLSTITIEPNLRTLSPPTQHGGF